MKLSSEDAGLGTEYRESRSVIINPRILDTDQYPRYSSISKKIHNSKIYNYMQ